jgi:hypothetical protein
MHLSSRKTNARRLVVKRLFQLALTAALGATAAIGGPITFNMTTTATGTLNGTGFTDALLTVTSFADTSLVTVSGSSPGQDYELIAGSSTVSIAGFGAPVTFTDLMFWEDPNSSGDIIFGDTTRGSGIGNAILGFTNPVPGSGLLTYNLQSSFGPAFGGLDFGVTAFHKFNNIPTSGGLLNVTAASGDVFVATATPVATPEPASFLIAGSAILGSFAVQRRVHRSGSGHGTTLSAGHGSA